MRFVVGFWVGCWKTQNGAATHVNKAVAHKSNLGTYLGFQPSALSEGQNSDSQCWEMSLPLWGPCFRNTQFWKGQIFFLQIFPSFLSKYLLDQALCCLGSCGEGSKLCCLNQQPLGCCLQVCHCLHCHTEPEGWVGRWMPPVGRVERQLASVMLIFSPITWFLANSLCLHPC